MKGAPAALAAALWLVSGCALTQQTRDAAASGFLQDYSTLAPGRGEQAQLLYIDPAADFSGFERVWIDPVTIWLEGDSALAKIPREEAQSLADYLGAALRAQLAQDFQLVDGPGPGTLRVRTAITEARGSRGLLDVVATVVPLARVLSAAKKLATGTHAVVGRARIEGEVLDVATGKRLIAAVDERAGGKALRGSTRTWSDVEAAYDYWARLIAARLALFRDIDKSESLPRVPDLL